MMNTPLPWSVRAAPWSPPEHTSSWLPFIEHGPRMFDGSPSSNGAPPTDRSAPVAGSSARTEPLDWGPPTGDQAWPPASGQVPPTLVTVLAVNRREPSHTPPASPAEEPAGGPGATLPPPPGAPGA